MKIGEGNLAFLVARTAVKFEPMASRTGRAGKVQPLSRPLSGYIFLNDQKIWMHGLPAFRIVISGADLRA